MLSLRDLYGICICIRVQFGFIWLKYCAKYFYQKHNSFVHLNRCERYLRKCKRQLNSISVLVLSLIKSNLKDHASYFRKYSNENNSKNYCEIKYSIQRRIYILAKHLTRRKKSISQKATF